MKSLFFVLGMFGGLVAILVVIGMLIEMITAPSLNDRRQIFYDWIKATSNTNLSFEEFERLRNKHMLPGQAAESSHSTIFIPMPIYR